MTHVARPDRATIAAFAAIVVFLGVNFVAVRFSNRELDPLWGAGLRFAIATTALLAIVAARRIPLPRGAALAGAALYGALAFGANFGLLYLALVAAPAALASVAFATIPLLALLLAVGAGLEPLRLRGIAGALVAVAGAVLIFGEQLGTSVPLSSAIAIALAAGCAASSAVVVKRTPRVHPVAMNAVGMATGAALLLPISYLAGETWTLPAQEPTWAALSWLVASSIVAFVLMVWVITRWTVSASTYTAVLSPLVTVAVATSIASEGVSALFLVGSAIVLCGVWLGAISGGRGSGALPPRRSAA